MYEGVRNEWSDIDRAKRLWHLKNDYTAYSDIIEVSHIVFSGPIKPVYFVRDIDTIAHSNTQRLGLIFL